MITPASFTHFVTTLTRKVPCAFFEYINVLYFDIEYFRNLAPAKDHPLPKFLHHALFGLFRCFQGFIDTNLRRLEVRQFKSVGWNDSLNVAVDSEEKTRALSNPKCADDERSKTLEPFSR